MGNKPSEADYFVLDVEGVHDMLDNLAIAVAAAAGRDA